MKVEFGVFDHVDRGETSLAALYESRLTLASAYDAAGFRTYHVAEHHATSLGMAPSTSRRWRSVHAGCASGRSCTSCRSTRRSA